jgi:predicted DNA-binding transcriptional regulator AlpA
MVDKFLTTAQLCALLNTSRWSVHRMHKDKTGPERTKISPRRWGYSERKVAEWLAARTETSAPQPAE